MDSRPPLTTNSLSSNIAPSPRHTHTHTHLQGPQAGCWGSAREKALPKKEASGSFTRGHLLGEAKLAFD